MKAVSTDIHYMNLLDEMDCDILEFEIKQNTGFIRSLVNLGYVDILYMKSPEAVKEWHASEQAELEETPPVSEYTIDKIWVASKGCYYSMELSCLNEETYGVVITKVPVKGSIRFL